MLRDKLRPTDFVARFGGEEFVLIFPQTTLSGGVCAVERLREAIGAEAMRHEGTALPRVTVSLGVTALDASGDAQRLLVEADQALYRAKKLGRNPTRSFVEAKL